MHETGLLDLLMGSGRPCSSHSCVVQRGAVADWWYSWPMASTLASLCLSLRRTFWTYVVTVNLFSLYLMNFMLHTMLDAAGVVLRVHYKSMKGAVLFSQGSVRTILRWGGHFSYISKKIYSSLQQCKNYKNRSRFSKVMITNVLPPFYGSQCIYVRVYEWMNEWMNESIISQLCKMQYKWKNTKTIWSTVVTGYR